MKFLTRYFIFIVPIFFSLFFSINAQAVDHITCHLTSSGIPGNTTTGQSYHNTYTCNNTYPSSFPAIQLAGSVRGDSSGMGITGSCQSPLSAGESCQFLLNFAPLASGSHTFNLHVAVGALYSLNLPAVSTVSSGPVNTVPTKKIIFYNNTDTTIYPIIEVGPTKIDVPGQVSGDNWLQAFFNTTNTADTYKSSRDYRMYINASPILSTTLNKSSVLSGLSGILPHSSVTVSLPLYSTLTTNPDPTMVNQYVDWWNGGRIIVLKDRNAAEKYYQDDYDYSSGPINAVLSSPQVCNGNSNSTCTSVPFFLSNNQGLNAGLPPDGPYQFGEYTLGDIDPNIVNGEPTLPFKTDFSKVNYNLSFVDSIYALPMALEPYDSTDSIGYTGSVESLGDFTDKINDFLNNSSSNWPKYINTPEKIPGTYNVFASINDSGLKISNPLNSSAIVNMVNLWNNCVAEPNSNPDSTCGDIKKVNALFQNNLQKYKNECGKPDYSPSIYEILQNVFGFTPFKCDGHTNDLKDTPGFDIGRPAYDNLQYNFDRYPNDPVFNPYVKLIHKDFNISGYAYSVDDAVGFLKSDGKGLIVAVGGDYGLPVKKPYDPKEKLTVALGNSGIGYKSFGVCQIQPNRDLNGAPSFTVSTVEYPCNIVLSDNNNIQYQFTMIQPPPFTSNSDKSTYISNCTPSAWCQEINLSSTSSPINNTINLPPPSAPLMATSTSKKKQ